MGATRVTFTNSEAVVDCPYATNFPFDYCFTDAHYAKVRIVALGKKSVRRRLVTRGLVHIYRETVNFVHVDTPHGPAEMWIKETIFNLLRAGDDIVIRYQVGRRSKSVKAKLAA